MPRQAGVAFATPAYAAQRLRRRSGGVFPFETLGDGLGLRGMTRLIWLLVVVTLVSPVFGQGDCPGDCDGDGRVTVDELTLGVGIVLGERGIHECFALNVNRDFLVDASEIVLAVTTAVGGCRSSIDDLLGAYDVVGAHVYPTYRTTQETLGFVELDWLGSPKLIIDFGQFTKADFWLRRTSSRQVRLDGHSIEQGDLVQHVSGSAQIRMSSDSLSIDGAVDSLFESFLGLSHRIEFQMVRSLDGDPTRFAGIYRFVFEPDETYALIPITLETTGAGTCGPAEVVDSSGTAVRELKVEDCYITSKGLFYYRESLVTIRGSLREENGGVGGDGTYNTGFGIGSSPRRVTWTASRQ